MQVKNDQNGQIDRNWPKNAKSGQYEQKIAEVLKMATAKKIQKT